MDPNSGPHKPKIHADEIELMQAEKMEDVRPDDQHGLEGDEDDQDVDDLYPEWSGSLPTNIHGYNEVGDY